MPPGLAPWPYGVGQVVAEFSVDGLTRTMPFWFLDPAGNGADVAGAETIADAFFLQAAPPLLNMLSAAAELTACRVTIASVNYARARVEVGPAPGAWSGAQAINATCGIHWIGATTGKGTQSVTRLVSCPDAFIDSTWRVSSVGFTNLRDHGADFLAAFNTVPNGRGGTILAGCLHQWRSGAPLVPPRFDITVGLEPTPHVCTMRRRLPKGFQVSP